MKIAGGKSKVDFAAHVRRQGPLAPRGTNMSSLKDLTAAKSVLSERLLRARMRGRKVAMSAALTIKAARKGAGHNVHGVGVASKIVGGKRTPTPCVRLYVVQKLPLSVLSRAARLPKYIDGVPTDVIEAPPARFHQLACSTNRQLRQRPIIGGISAAHSAVNITTLGCFCRSLRAGDAPRRYMLSCNHAFANMNNSVPGDDILQPSPGDGGGSSPDGDVIGSLARFVTLHLDGSTPNRVDAAIAEIAPEVAVRREICTIGRLRGVKRAVEGMKVRKHGRTTNYTEGTVEGIDFDWTIPYGTGYWALVVNQLFIEPTAGFAGFARPGDSGSVVVARNSRHAVGLYFAGADDGSYGLANPITEVCRVLKISIP